MFRQAFNLLRPSLGITVTELGCGTGRNTVKLFDNNLKGPTIVHLNALDFSQAMLGKARTTISKALSRQVASDHPTKVRCVQFDALNPGASPQIPKVDMMVSTLVLEHLPIDDFFSAVKSLLKPGGVLVLTNMHSEMGVQSRAGFRDAETGTKFQGTSYVHTIDEVIRCGAKNGFSVDEPFLECGIQEEDVQQGRVGDRGRKWIGVKVWFGLVMQLQGVRRSQAQVDLARFDAGGKKECAEDVAKANHLGAQLFQALADVESKARVEKDCAEALAKAEQDVGRGFQRAEARTELGSKGPAVALARAEEAKDQALTNLPQAQIAQAQAEANLAKARATLEDIEDMTSNLILDTEFSLTSG